MLRLALHIQHRARVYGTALSLMFFAFDSHRDSHRVLNLLLRLRVASILLQLLEASAVRKWQQLSGKKV